VLFDDKEYLFRYSCFDSDAKHINARELVRDADFSMKDTVAILNRHLYDRRNGFSFL